MVRKQIMNAAIMLVAVCSLVSAEDSKTTGFQVSTSNEYGKMSLYLTKNHFA